MLSNQFSTTFGTCPGAKGDGRGEGWEEEEEEEEEEEAVYHR